MRPSVSLLLTLLLSALPISNCTAGEIRAPEVKDLERIKAVQILILQPADPYSTREWLRRHRELGFDTVILRAFHLPGDRPHEGAGRVDAWQEGVYYPTRHAPVIKDIMTGFVTLCHEEGLKAYAWMVTRKARFGNTNLPRDVVFSPMEKSFRETSDLDILNEDVYPYLKNLFMDLAATGVDGILLQDDLVSRMGDGFSTDNMELYREQTDDPTPPYSHLERARDDDGRMYLRATAHFDPWVRWKSSRIIDLAKNLEDTVRSYNPKIRIALNLMYEAVTSPRNGRLWLSQDLKSALENGPSYAALMLYHRQMQKELGLDLPQVVKLLEQSLDGLADRLDQRGRVILKFQTKDWKSGEPVPSADLVSALLTTWGEGWSVALIPPPSEKQTQGIARILEDL
ncbi:hypothetical protein EP232_03905 [bacterium]|nr:MAG: hypothetical protein EP232_03905 [bacterium]